MSSIQDAKTFIASASKDELVLLQNYIKIRYKELEAKSAQTIDIGDNVWFDARRRGVISGTVIGFSRTAIRVKATNGVVWKVGPLLIHKADK